MALLVCSSRVVSENDSCVDGVHEVILALDDRRTRHFHEPGEIERIEPAKAFADLADRGSRGLTQLPDQSLVVRERRDLD